MRSTSLGLPGFMIVSIAILYLGGCAQPPTGPIDQWADAAVKTSDAYVASVDATTAAETKQRISEIIGPHPRRKAQLVCGADHHCRILSKSDDESKEVKPPTPTAMATVSRPIATYAKSLKDVAHANTATVVDASVTAAASSVADIGSALVQAHAAQLKDWQDKAADPHATQPQKEEANRKIAELQKPSSDKSFEQISAYAAPIGGLVSWIAGQYIAHVQLQGLRSATANANPTLKKIAPELDQFADVEGGTTENTLFAKMNHMKQVFEDTGTEDSFKSYSDSVDAYNAAVDARRVPIFQKLADSHDALTKELNSSNVDLDQVGTLVQAFATQAAAFDAASSKVAEEQKKESKGN